MNRFVIVALLLMAWAYWELSGGADFEPERRDIAEAAPEALTPETATPAPEITPQPEAAPEVETVSESSPAAGPEDQPDDDMATESTPDPARPIEHSFDENPLTATPEPPSETMPEDTPETAPESAETAPETTPDAAPATGGNLHVVTGSTVNLREGPGTGFATMGQVTEGMILDVLEIRDGWAYVALQDRVEQGWMSASFLAPL